MEQNNEYENSVNHQEDELPFPNPPILSTHIDDFSHHAHYEVFNEPITLDDNQLKVVFRILKHYFEEHIGLEVPDELFIELIKIYPYLAPKHPLASPYAGRGYTDPVHRLLDKHGFQSIAFQDISTFFVNHKHGGRLYRRLILHVPHASKVFPPSSKHIFIDLDCDERLLVDYYTDELFVPSHECENIEALVFPYCRLYCDVERMVNDPLEGKGLGISFYHDVRYRFGIRRRSFSSLEEAFKLYVDFHAEMSKSIIKDWDRKLLIDCHSFSSQPNLLCSNPPDIDICIGFNDDSTRPEKVVIGKIKEHFLSRGYKVGINTPFSNSKTFEVPVRYHSVMIEVNKRLYMNEQTLEKTDGFDRLKADIQSLYDKLLQQGAH